MKRKIKVIAIALGLAVVFSGVTGCSKDTANTEITADKDADDKGKGDIITMVTDDDQELSDLFDLYGTSIDDLASKFPDLQYDDSYKTNSDGFTEVSEPTDNMEKTSDGYALAGPFFYIDNDGKVVGINYGGREYSVCKITLGMSMSEAQEIVKSQGYEFSSVEIAHGTAKYVAIYEKDGIVISIASDADGDFNKTEENDVTGNADSITIYNK